MAAVTVRLPEALERQLDAEAALSGRPRSAVMREAIAGFLQARERARFMADYVAAARAGYQNPPVRAEALAIAEAFLPLENEALAAAEGQDPAAPAADEERWWR